VKPPPSANARRLLIARSPITTDGAGIQVGHEYAAAGSALSAMRRAPLERRRPEGRPVLRVLPLEASVYPERGSPAYAPLGLSRASRLESEPCASTRDPEGTRRTSASTDRTPELGLGNRGAGF
jgi:hypothetical protein